MARQRFRRKDLKRPDQFVSKGQRLLVWAVENRAQLTRGAVAAGVVVLLGGGYVGLRSSRAEQANTDLGRALRPLETKGYAEAATQLAAVAERWPSTAAGRMAPLYAASAALKAEKAGEATSILDRVAASGLPPYLQQLLPLLEAFAAEESGNLATAAARFAAATAGDGPYTALALFGEARTREALGQQAEARTLYERLVQEFPQGPDTELAKTKLDTLAG